MTSLSNKTILVTGASSGIGRAVSILCSQAGANLVINGRDIVQLNKTNELLQKKAQIISADLSDENEINKMVEQLPLLDGIVHCAGIIKPVPIKFLKSKHITDVFGVNFFSAVLLSSSVLSSKKLNTGSSVVFISSISSHFPYTGGSLYTSSKAAIEAFSRAFALENASKKIRANTIAPALVKTKILEETDNAFFSGELTEVEKQYPLGFGEPEDIANACVFLLSGASKWITGTTLIMDGGLLLNSTK